MARLSLARHRKFRRLGRALGALAGGELAPLALARGVLELVWETGWEAVSPYVGTTDDIADACGWRGEAGALVTALVTAGFLDPVGEGYAIHDFWEHAPPYVRLRWSRTHPDEAPPWTCCIPQQSQPEACDIAARSCDNVAPPIPSHPRTYRQSIAAAAAINLRVLVRLGHELAGQAFETEADRKEALKTLAAHYGVPYDGRSITKAIDLVLHSRTPAWVASPQPALVRRVKRSRR